MAKNERIWGTTLIALVALLVPFSVSAESRCTLAGTWIGENDAGLAFVITFIPLDATQNKLASIADAANDPSGFGVFPTAVDGTPFQGVAERTGRYTFEQTALAYARDDFNWVGTFAVSGIWTLSQDCNTADVMWYASTYFPGEDPIAGEPFFCFPPIAGSYHRVPVVASFCEP